MPSTRRVVIHVVIVTVLLFLLALPWLIDGLCPDTGGCAEVEKRG